MSVAGAGTETGAPPAEGAPEAAPAQGAQAPAGLPDNFAERFEQFASTMDALPERLERLEQGAQAPPAGEPAQAQVPDTRYLLDPQSGMFMDRLTGQWLEEPPGGDYGEPELTAEAVQQMVEQGVQQALAPQARQQMLAQVAALEEKYPELRDEAIAAEVKQEAQRLVQATMPGADAEAWKNPALIEKIYLARSAGERAEGEVPPTGEPSTQLESPSAAAAGVKELEDEGDAIVKAGQRGSFLM